MRFLCWVIGKKFDTEIEEMASLGEIDYLVGAKRHFSLDLLENPQLELL